MPRYEVFRFCTATLFGKNWRPDSTQKRVPSPPLTSHSTVFQACIAGALAKGDDDDDDEGPCPKCKKTVTLGDLTPIGGGGGFGSAAGGNGSDNSKNSCFREHAFFHVFEREERSVDHLFGLGCCMLALVGLSVDERVAFIVPRARCPQGPGATGTACATPKTTACYTRMAEGTVTEWHNANQHQHQI